MPPRPTWYPTARTIGGVPWVPFQVAAALQQQLDRHAERLGWAEQALEQSQRQVRGATSRLSALQGDPSYLRGAGRHPLQERVEALEGALSEARAQLEAALEEAAIARTEAEEAREQAHQDSLALAELRRQERAQEEVADPRVAELKADLANVRRHVETEIARGIRLERVARLQGMLEVHDDLLRSLHYQTDITSPWYQGHSAILKRTEQELTRAGARPTGKVGERFDPTRHEALAMRPAGDGPADVVVAVEQVGWALEDGSLVRPARVIVSG